jgi:hypothetical protein
MTDHEMIAVLEGIARGKAAPASARVTAVRTLWEWRRAESEDGPTGFDELYADEFTARRRER